VLWCWDTRRCARALARGDAHGTSERDAAVACSWTLDGRKLAISRASGSVDVWDVAEEDVVAVIANVGTCASASFLSSSAQGGTLVISPLNRGAYIRGTSARGGREIALPSPYGGEEDAPPSIAVSSKSGKYVFAGDARGGVSVVDATTMALVQTIAVPDASLVKRLELCRNGKYLLAVTNAPTIFGMDVDEANEAGVVLTPGLQYESPAASRSQWGAAAYHWDGSSIYGVNSGAAHEIHVWDRASGALKCVLEGPSEAKGVVQLAMHPVRDIAVALGANGSLYVWSRKHVEDWSAFDPAFVTLVENKEYVEREDEFDARPPPEKPEAVNVEDAEIFDFPPEFFDPGERVKYYTDEDEDVMHSLPLRIIPNPEIARLMEERRAKWERKAKRRERREAEAAAAAANANAEDSSEEDVDTEPDENVREEEMPDVGNYNDTN